MGAANSIEQYDNDFELVIRVSKELERVLTDDLRAPSYCGLKDKIDIVSEHYPMRAEVKKAMYELVQVRNSLVHDYHVNELPDRAYFLQKFKTVKTELSRLSGKTTQEDSDSISGGAVVLLGLGALAIGALAVASQDDEQDKKKKSEVRRSYFD